MKAAIWKTPVVSQTEQQNEVQPFSDQYRLLDRLCADCEYFLGAGQRAEKHLWAGSVDAQIEKMRELYAQLPENLIGISLDVINAYARRMAAPEPVENTDGSLAGGNADFRRSPGRPSWAD